MPEVVWPAVTWAGTVSPLKLLVGSPQNGSNVT